MERMIVQHDFKMVNRFLDVLTGSTDEVVTFQTFNDKKDNNSTLAKVHHLKRNEINKLTDYQEKGCGVYVMVNAGDGKSRKAENVVKVRALFIDLDGSPWQPAAEMLTPHIRVESSPGRWHLYWKVLDCSLEQFKPLQQAIAKKFNGDKSCVDLSRILRVPGFLHLKKQPVLTRLNEASDFPAYAVQQVIDSLGLQPAATPPPRNLQTAPASKRYECMDVNGEVFNLTAWAGKNPLFDIVGNFNPQFLRGAMKDGKQHVECPFSHNHTDPNTDLATFISNAYPPQFPAFDIHCMHNHCAGRDRLEFLSAMFTKGMLSTEILQTPASFQKRKPPYMNYPAQEVAAALQLKTLAFAELRILLHLMHISWQDDEGTLPDDDWIISRSLGLHEKEWLVFRDILTRTGWIMTENNRLFTYIFRREFLKAQTALMKSVEAGRSGGKKSAALRASPP